MHFADDDMAKPNTMTQTRVRLWNVNEYHRMLETGIITADERVELIDGQVIPMSAKNPPHAATTLCASDYLKLLLAEVALVRVQDPIQFIRNKLKVSVFCQYIFEYK